MSSQDEKIASKVFERLDYFDKHGICYEGDEQIDALNICGGGMSDVLFERVINEWLIGKKLLERIKLLWYVNSNYSI